MTGKRGASADLELRDDPRGLERDLLALDAAAARAYYDFVFPDAASARAHVERLFAAGVADCSPPLCRLAVDAAGLAGMYCAGSGTAWRQRRLAAAVTTMRDRANPPAIIRERAHLAADALLRLADGDWYLSRIAVAPDRRGRGIGRALLDDVVADAAAAGASSVVLEVEASNDAAVAMYAAAGFGTEREATAREGGATLAYVHMRLPIGGAR